MAECKYETERLAIGEWHSTAAVTGLKLPVVVASMLTERVTETLPADWHGQFDEHRAKIWIEQRDSEGAMLLAVRSTDDAPAGLLVLFEDATHPATRIHVGYIVAEAMWGAGYATEMLAGFVDWCRNNLGEWELMAGVDGSNGSSVRVLEKCGFEPDQDAKPGGDSLMYRLAV